MEHSDGKVDESDRRRREEAKQNWEKDKKEKNETESE